MNRRLAMPAVFGIPPWAALIDGDDGGGGGGNPPAPPTAPPAPAPPAPAPAGVGPNGYPEGKPLAEMTDREQAAYWRHHARKHEDASKAKDTEIAALKPRADQYAALEEASRSEAERAVAAAEQRGRDEGRTAAQQEALTKYGAALVQARFESVLAGRLTPKQVATLVGGLNVAGFLGADGLPDAARISEYAAAIPAAPDAPGGGVKPPDLGGGRTAPPPTTGVEAGRALYAARHPKRTT